MFSKNKELIAGAIVVFLFIFLIFSANNVLGDKNLLNHSINQEIVISGLYGLWTALFAFIFLGVSSVIAKINKRKVQHYNSLVNLGWQLNEMIGVIRDNLYLIEGLRGSIVKGNIYWGTLKPLYIDRSHFENLYDLNLINELFSLYYKMRQINDDIENLQAGYIDLKNAYVHKDITVAHYVTNTTIISEQFKIIEIFLEKLEGNVLTLITKIRIQLRKDKPFLTWLQQKFIYATENNITFAEFEKEKKAVNQEIEDSSKESKKETEEALKKKK